MIDVSQTKYNDILPFNVRAREHIKLTFTVPANSTIMEKVRGVGQCGLVSNITVSDPAVTVQIAGRSS